MAKTKKTKKTKQLPASARHGKRALHRTWQDDTRASNGLIPQTVAAPATTPVAAPVANTGRMTKARLLSPAQKLGSDLVRFLRIDAKHPYGPRGKRAIVALAKQVGPAGLEELLSKFREGDSLKPVVQALHETVERLAVEVGHLPNRELDAAAQQ